jgi:sec-independent protein translocase protein TatC
MALDQLPEGQEDQREMTFFDHIDELRGHLIRSVIAIAVAAVLLFVNKHILFDVILFGPVHLDFPSYKLLCRMSYLVTGTDKYCIKDMGFVLSNISITGQFTQHLFVSIIGGLIVAFPYILWEFWRFIKPALTKKERNYSRGLVFFSSGLFFIGILFGYFLLTPMSVNFLGSYRVSDIVSNEINLESYLSFVTTLTFATGLVFELPILVYFLAKIGLIGSKWMRTHRRHALVIILIVAAILTPSPDVASQVLMFIPLYSLYELSIFVALSVERNQAKKAA